MKKKTIKYTNDSIGKVKIINDFLPPPDQLVLKGETVKITLDWEKLNQISDSNYLSTISVDKSVSWLLKIIE